MRVFMLNMNPFLLTPSLQLSPLNLASLSLLSLRILPLRIFDLDQTLVHIRLKGLWTLDPLFFLDYSVMMAQFLGKWPIWWLVMSMSIYFLIRPQQFDKLKRALNCTASTWWMYSFWHQHFTFYCCTLIESCSCLFHKQLCALMGFALSSTFSLIWGGWRSVSLYLSIFQEAIA